MEIASKRGLTTQNIYHHSGGLKGVYLIRVNEKRLASHLFERYYTVTADTFIYNKDRMDENDY